MNNDIREEKVKDFKKSIKNLLIYCKAFLPYIIISVITAIIGSVIALIGPNKISDINNIIINGAMTGIDISKVKDITSFLLILYCLNFILGYIGGFSLATFTQKFSYKLRKEIANKINILPLKYFDNTSYGDVLSRITNDVDTISQSLNQSLDTLVSAVTLLIGSLIMMFYTNYIMAFTAIFATFFGFGIMFVILTKSQKYFVLQQKELGRLNGHIEEVYSGHNIIKVSNGIEEVTEKFDEINNSFYTNARKSQFMSGLMGPIMGFMGNFGYVAVCIIGALLVINNKITFGTIMAFTIYIRLFSQPLSQIAQVMTSMQSMAAASERVFEFLCEETLKDENGLNEKLDIANVKGNVSFEHVKFGYNDDKIIINDFSAKIKAGNKIAIVGPTGAGKTTIVNLLMKFYTINSGDIKIDDISINSLKRENIHELFCMILQDTWVFNGTIKDNIVYNQKNIDDDMVIKACKTVGLHHFIKTLPDGYNTSLGDIENLSSGQKQLLTIARGMIKNSPLLILDEATSSVDTRTEELVQKAMDKLTVGKTSFIIAHRLSTIKNADLILVMNHGNIIEQGTHNELLSKNGFYAELYNSQFEEV